jgi:N-acetylglucosaminyltransferase
MVGRRVPPKEEKSSILKRLARYVRISGKIGGFWIGLIALIITMSAGIGIGLSFRYTLTPFGVGLFVRFIWQIYRAERNNRRWMRMVRLSFILAAKEFQEKNRQSPKIDNPRKLLSYCEYDEWRTKLWTQFPWVKSNWRRIVMLAVQHAANGRPLPTIGIEMPIHGLAIEEVRNAVDALQKQTYRERIGSIVLGVNDSNNHQLRRAVRQLYYELNDPVFVHKDLPRDHKRGAMAEGYRIHIEQRTDLSLNVDGDTVLDTDALAIGVLCMLLDSRVRGITSNVRLRNRDKNLLTILTAQRYNYANFLERAAQSWKYAVTCLSGPFMLLFTNDIAEILLDPARWEEQRFLKELVGPGDDRQLTIQLNFDKKGTVFIPDIIVWTDCPETILIWERQQLRWIRSGMRSFFSTNFNPKYYDNVPAWSIFDQFYLALFTFLLAGVVITILYRVAVVWITFGAVAAWDVAWPYMLIVLIANLIRTSYGIIRNKDWRYVLSFFYLLVHIRYLMWLKIKAVFSLTNSNWLSRGSTLSI